MQRLKRAIDALSRLWALCTSPRASSTSSPETMTASSFSMSGHANSSTRQKTCTIVSLNSCQVSILPGSVAHCRLSSRQMDQASGRTSLIRIPTRLKLIILLQLGCCGCKKFSQRSTQALANKWYWWLMMGHKISTQPMQIWHRLYRLEDALVSYDSVQLVLQACLKTTVIS